MAFMSPRATVSDIWVSDSLIWILGSTGDQRWTEARSDGYTNLGTLFDSVIEVLDASTLSVVESARFDIQDGILTRFLGPGRVMAFETRPLFDRISIWSVQTP